MNSSFRIAAIIAIASFAGCHSDRPTIVPVSGQVLIDGRPLTYGVVQFTPHGSRSSFGNLDQDGRFRLTCRDPDDGAVLGKHTVAVNGAEVLLANNTMTKQRWHAPKKYSEPATAGLSQEVSSATDNLVINISWNGGKPFEETIHYGPDLPEAGKRIE